MGWTKDLVAKIFDNKYPVSPRQKPPDRQSKIIHSRQRKEREESEKEKRSSTHDKRDKNKITGSIAHEGEERKRTERGPFWGAPAASSSDLGKNLTRIDSWLEQRMNKPTQPSVVHKINSADRKEPRKKSAAFATKRVHSSVLKKNPNLSPTGLRSQTPLSSNTQNPTAIRDPKPKRGLVIVKAEGERKTEREIGDGKRWNMEFQRGEEQIKWGWELLNQVFTGSNSWIESGVCWGEETHAVVVGGSYLASGPET